ncbi:hypothetical protein LG943_00690 [Streptomonospora sp. S1-112]|uniref:Uncharacterized protein n=1 Tax=Streptomonospora mangrovi TaxID=2883123 RepID=A0A9X3SDN8_9ACTN|nr:hypothetical protein [Streptomonospora mangrovi]MDA0562860.1 hypothetical protein [Streptomonospora mangrovi]
MIAMEATRRYTPPPIDPDTYAVLADLTVRHPRWAITYDADERGEVLFHAHCTDFGYFAVADLATLRRVIVAAEQTEEADQ